MFWKYRAKPNLTSIFLDNDTKTIRNAIEKYHYPCVKVIEENRFHQ